MARPLNTSSSARGLLISVLGELVVPNGGEAWTQTLVAALDDLGVQEKAARQAIARMHEGGWLDRTRVGRQTRWRVTDFSTGLLTAGAERIYGFGQHVGAWDGSWLMLMASVPERDRRDRYRMGVGLNWAGFGSLGQGTWISPWVDREAAVVELLADLDVDATSFRSRLGELGSGERLVEQAWDLPELRQRYDAFLADSKPTGSQPAADLVGLVHRWRRFPLVDPDLPTELLPADWPGPEAAQRFAMQRAELLDEAVDWWTSTEASFSPGS